VTDPVRDRSEQRCNTDSGDREHQVAGPDFHFFNRDLDAPTPGIYAGASSSRASEEFDE
jgi:hypothetical protein